MTNYFSGDSIKNVGGNLTLSSNGAELRLTDGNNSYYSGFKAGSNASANIMYTLPNSVTDGYVLSTDSNGALSWVANGSSSGDVSAATAFNTNGVIMTCTGSSKTIGEATTTLTTNGQSLTVTGSLTSTQATTLSSVAGVTTIGSATAATVSAAGIVKC